MHSFSRGLEAAKCMESPRSRENQGGNVAKFRGMAAKFWGNGLERGGQRPELGKLRMPCQGAWTLPSRQWMSREITPSYWVSDAWGLVFWVEEKTHCLPLLGLEFRGRKTEQLSANRLKSGCLGLNLSSATC